MCDNCKDNKPEAKELINDLQELKISPPSQSSDSDVLMFCQPLDISIENLEEDSTIQLDKDEFVKGLKDASYICGVYTALINTGWSMEDTVAYIFNFMNVKHNIETTTINANASIECSKNVSDAKSKEML